MRPQRRGVGRRCLTRRELTAAAAQGGHLQRAAVQKAPLTQAPIESWAPESVRISFFTKAHKVVKLYKGEIEKTEKIGR